MTLENKGGCRLKRYEMHLHTSQASPCGILTAEEAVKAYVERGYQGIFTTDHYGDWYFQSVTHLSPTQKMNHLIAGHMAAKKAGLLSGLTVHFGIELRFDDQTNFDYLIYGILPEDLYAYPNLHLMSKRDFRTLANQKNWLIIHAHPFRFPMFDPVSKEAEEHAKFIDGVEGYNGHPYHTGGNDLTQIFANAYPMLQIYGSDMHEVEGIATTAVDFPEDVESVSDMIEALRLGRHINRIAPF